ncbi:MAG: sigma-70 family RNA polymerase sigma factor [Acidobacteriota bacterium]
MTAHQDPQVRQARRLFEENHDRFTDRARWVGHRQGIPHTDLDDFVSDVMVKLIDDDFAVLRAFRGRGDVLTYVTAVIIHLAQDQRNRLWGKWRPSAEAKRGGPVAIELECLLYRDGHGFQEACAMVRERFPATEQKELDALASRLPPRTPRRFETDTGLTDLTTTDRADDKLEGEERDARKRHVLESLDDALKALAPEWQLALRMFYQRGWKAARIARALDLETKQVYRLFEHAKRRLRKNLEARGLTGESALADLGWDLDPATAPEPLSEN